MTNKRIWQVQSAQVRQFYDLDETSRTLMRAAMSQLQLSARAYHRILKLGRTIDDLAGSDRIQRAPLVESIQFGMRLITL